MRKSQIIYRSLLLLSICIIGTIGIYVTVSLTGSYELLYADYGYVEEDLGSISKDITYHGRTGRAQHGVKKFPPARAIGGDEVEYSLYKIRGCDVFECYLSRQLTTEIVNRIGAAKQSAYTIDAKLSNGANYKLQLDQQRLINLLQSQKADFSPCVAPNQQPFSKNEGGYARIVLVNGAIDELFATFTADTTDVVHVYDASGQQFFVLSRSELEAIQGEMNINQARLAVIQKPIYRDGNVFIALVLSLFRRISGSLLWAGISSFFAALILGYSCLLVIGSGIRRLLIGDIADSEDEDDDDDDF